MYQPKKNYAFYYSLHFLHYLHYYPSAEDEKNLKFYHFVSALIRILSSFVLIECILHITNAIKKAFSVLKAHSRFITLNQSDIIKYSNAEAKYITTSDLKNPKIMYAPKKNDAFFYTVLFSRLLHYYPLGVKESDLKYYKATSILLRILSSFVWIECGLHCVNSLKNQIPVDISEDVVGLTGLGNSMLVCILFEVNAKKWSRLFSDVTDTTKFGTPENMTEVVNKVNRYSLVYFLYCNVGIVIYGLVALLDTGKCERLNQEKGIHEICGTPTPLWWPNEDISPMTKTIITFCQVFSIAYYVPPSAILTFVAWEAAEVIMVKIDHLKGLFQNAFNTQDKHLQSQRLKFCIRYHQEVLRICDNLNHVSSRLIGQLSFVAAVILSCIGTQMLKEYSIGAMIHLMGYGLAVFLICQAGQKVRDETYDIQDAVYASNWYEVNPKLAKDTQLILLRCQKPVCLEAVPFGIFNYNLLIIIIKTSYSYLTLINKTSEESI